MELIEYIDVPAKKKEINVGTECDRCKNKIQTDDCFDQFNCTVEEKTGEIFPSGGQTFLKTVDLCQNCSNWLFELLTLNNVRINNSEWDY